jgi:hypothetical protein
LERSFGVITIFCSALFCFVFVFVFVVGCCCVIVDNQGGRTYAASWSSNSAAAAAGREVMFLFGGFGFGEAETASEAAVVPTKTCGTLSPALFCCAEMTITKRLR